MEKQCERLGLWLGLRRWLFVVVKVAYRAIVVAVVVQFCYDGVDLVVNVLVPGFGLRWSGRRSRSLCGFGFAPAISVWAGDMASPDRFPVVVRRLQVIYAGGALAFASVPGILADRFGGSYIPAYVLFSAFLALALDREKDARRLLLLTGLFMLTLSPLLLYAIIICIDSTRKNHSLRVGLLSVPAAFVQLMGYGLGFLKAWWKRIVLRQDEFTAFEKNFYK